MYLVVQKDNIFVIIYFSKYSSVIIVTVISSCVLVSASQDLCELSYSRYSALVMSKKCLFFLKKGMKGIFDYVLEFMLSLDKNAKYQ